MQQALQKSFQRISSSSIGLRATNLQLVDFANFATKRKTQDQANDSKQYAKQPRNPYILFCNFAREKLVIEHPDAQSKEIMKMLASKWSSMSASEKQTFNKQAAADKQRFEQEISSGMEAKPRRRKNRGVESEEPKKPKRAPGPYAAFVKSMYISTAKENPDKGATGVMKLIAEKWSKLSDEEKASYRVSSN